MRSLEWPPAGMAMTAKGRLEAAVPLGARATAAAELAASLLVKEHPKVDKMLSLVRRLDAGARATHGKRMAAVRAMAPPTNRQG